MGARWWAPKGLTIPTWRHSHENRKHILHVFMFQQNFDIICFFYVLKNLSLCSQDFLKKKPIFQILCPGFRSCGLISGWDNTVTISMLILFHRQIRVCPQFLFFINILDSFHVDFYLIRSIGLVWQSTLINIFPCFTLCKEHVCFLYCFWQCYNGHLFYVTAWPLSSL